MSNFAFLKEEFSYCYKLAIKAEKNLYSDSHTTFFKIGVFAETIIRIVYQARVIGDVDLKKQLGVDTTHQHRLDECKDKGLLEDTYPVQDGTDISLYRMFEMIRYDRNTASHELFENEDRALIRLEYLHFVAWWFYLLFSEKCTAVPAPFVTPEKKVPLMKSTFDAQIKAQKEDIASKQKQIDDLTEQISKTISVTPELIEERAKNSRKFLVNITLPIAEVRLSIQSSLKNVGWATEHKDGTAYSYSNGDYPNKEEERAISNWPTDSGNADFALFLGTTLVGLIRVKSREEDVSSVINNECLDLARSVKDEHSNYVKVKYPTAEYSVPFVFATNGRGYFAQIKQKSGIWFKDLREESSVSYPLEGWMSPENMRQKLSKNVENTNLKLKNLTFEQLQNEKGLDLRYYQVEAIEAVEKAVLANHKTALLHMATGTGKTVTVLGMIYRFLKAQRFYRILYLVDRTSLGDQANDVFESIKLEGTLSLDKLYGLKTLGTRSHAPGTKVHISTVQAMVHSIVLNKTDLSIGVGDYDLVIVDEAHRGYILDRKGELSDTELEYRDETDFQSKYRAVIDYFDAFKIALTATPAPHTTELFGNPVYTYSYQQGVIDGFLSNYNPPFLIETKSNTDGITITSSEITHSYDKSTQELHENKKAMTELKIPPNEINRSVILESFNRLVLEKIADRLISKTGGKTLIFAENDDHADLIVTLLHDIYAKDKIGSEAVVKITGSAGDEKRKQELIRCFRNEINPKIAVTVDLLTTGIDIPAVTTLVFLRRVQSPVLFDQMIGRGTRLCPEINKTSFDIYDAVGIFKDATPLTTMCSVPTSEVAAAHASDSITLEDIISKFSPNITQEFKEYHIDLAIKKIEAMVKRMSSARKKGLETILGVESLSDWLSLLRKNNPDDAMKKLLDLRTNTDFFILLTQPNQTVLISSQEDTVISSTRVYGENLSAEEFKEKFKAYLNNSSDIEQIVATICECPSTLTRDDLFRLRSKLLKDEFHETHLLTAYAHGQNDTVTTDFQPDIVNIIRHLLADAQLMDKNQRITTAFEKLKRERTFTRDQAGWIENIKQNVIANTLLTVADFNSGAFVVRHRGFIEFDRIFDGKLTEIVNEINEYLYQDGGTLK